MDPMPPIKFAAERRSAPRIPDEKWDAFRSIIAKRFKTDSLASVMKFMEREHKFFASKRQYVYRLGHWGCTKYKKNKAKAPAAAEAVSDDSAVHVHPSPSGPPCPAIPALPPRDVVAGPVLASPTLGASNSSPHQQWPWALLAEILFALGATACSFNINVGLENPLACIRTAQTRAQDCVARDLARNFLGTGPRPPQAWETKFWELALAHTWGRGYDAEDGLEQIMKATEAIITETYDPQHNEFQDHLESLPPRGPRLDIPTYLFLRSAMEWYNRERDGEFNIASVLDQFIRQQLAPCGQEHRAAPLPINCISSCLTWCIGMLEDPQTIPPGNPHLPHSIPAAETYLVLCTLWRLWISQHPIHPSPFNGRTTQGATPVPLPWANDSEPQLGIPPTELLSTVVCMIMAAVPWEAGYPNIPVLRKALAGAKFLDKLSHHNLIFVDDPSSDGLLRRFLRQVWATNSRLLAQPGEGREFHLSCGAVDTGAFWPYFRFAAGVLEIPVLTATRAAGGMGGEGAVVYPIVLAEAE